MRVAACLGCACAALVSTAAPFGITAEAAIVVEASTGKVLWSKNADEQMFPASTTKIMTALLLLENTKPLEGIRAPLDVAEVGGSSLWMEPRELIRAEDMAYALMLRSANDGAYATALHIAGSVEKFAEMMNARADAIGCTGTHFVNPHGLHDPGHYTTARDLALIAVEALKNEIFCKIVGTGKKRIFRTIKLEDRLLVNHNDAIFDHAPTDGIKTGYTGMAGRCFVGSASKNGQQVVTVVLNSQNWEGDHIALAEWGIKSLRWIELAPEGQPLGEIAVEGGRADSVPVVSAKQVLTPSADGITADYEVKIQGPSQAPIEQGDVVGVAILIEPDGTKHEVDLIATQSVADIPTIGERLSSPTSFLLLAGMVGGAVFMRRRAKGWTAR